MAKKRKRTDNVLCQPRKILKPSAARTQAPAVTSSPSSLLALYYPKVLSLKDFFLDRLPITSRVRRKRIETLASEDQISLLNTTLIGILTKPDPAVQAARAAEFAVFTQSQRLSTDDNTAKTQTCSVDEVVDFVIWTLFRGALGSLAKPRHLLCNGLQRTVAPLERLPRHDEALQLPGIVQQHPNENLKTLRTGSWIELIALLGAAGERIFVNLLLDCAIFTQLSNGNKNYFQLSGIPVSDLKSLNTNLPVRNAQCTGSLLRPPTEIKFIRNRILYAKSSLNGKGQAHLGLKHVHVLQRYRQHDDEVETVHVMKHIFPRQFGLHNVFTSSVDSKDSTQPLPDYTYREDEIRKDKKHPTYWLPKRLRSAPTELIRRMRKSHARCSYSQLLRHHCPVSASRDVRVAVTSSRYHKHQTSSIPLVTQTTLPNVASKPSSSPAARRSSETSYLPHATPTANIGAFCKGALLRLLPAYTLGQGKDGRENWHTLLHNVDRFIDSRRFETLSLQEVVSGIKIKSIPWLESSNIKGQQNIPKSEWSKRCEIFHELVYYIFDSLLIPLIRSNFYVTETGPSRSKLLYFRHDVWRKLSAPSLAMLRLDLYEPLKPPEVRITLRGRTLGYSHVRLLPKAEGTRTITNLKRRMVKTTNGRRVLGPSINAQLGPIFSALNCERFQTPKLLGCALFSVSDLHKKLKGFKACLSHGTRLFLIKVDVQSCFDSIPQARLLEVIKQILGSAWYKTTRYAEVKLAEKGVQRRQKFMNIARPAGAGAAFSEEIAENLVASKQGAVLAEIGNARDWQQHQLLNLLQDHVQNNIVKIGKKHLKQKEGIPQGSVLSSILCSYFYAAFESEHLGFLDTGSSLLLRLIDDFLLITTDKCSARRFAETMMRTHPAYGILTNAEKSLANFDIRVGTSKIPQHQGRAGFPYCGMRINVSTLEVSKDRESKYAAVNNGLTVDTTRSAGSTFQRKMLLAFKIQMQTMLVDMTLNTRKRVISTLMEAFAETAMKMYRYWRSMQPHQRPNERLVIAVIEDLVRFASRYLERKCDTAYRKDQGNRVTRKQICWMASASMEPVFLRKSSGHHEVISWLRSLRTSSEASMGMSRQSRTQLVTGCVEVFRDHVY